MNARGENIVQYNIDHSIMEINIFPIMLRLESHMRDVGCDARRVTYFGPLSELELNMCDKQYKSDQISILSGQFMEIDHSDTAQYLRHNAYNPKLVEVRVLCLILNEVRYSRQIKTIFVIRCLSSICIIKLCLKL